MKNKRREDTEILPSKNQLSLFGYTNYFNSMVKLFKKKELPNCILFSGPKGLGKSTFVYHFINYLLSKNEKKSYSIDNLKINSENMSYKLLNKNIHPNFFLLENNSTSQGIKVDQVRNLLKFIYKSTYLQNLKIAMIDNAENLNLNSSNALLKALEEPDRNTFFFIIHNNSFKILDTIKSRCVEFRIFFKKKLKEEIFRKIMNQYENKFDEDVIIDNLYYDTPGNLSKYLAIINEFDIDISKNKLKTILLLFKKYENNNRHEILRYLLILIEKFYNELYLKKNKNFTNYTSNYQKIIQQISNMKKFNLNEKNTMDYVSNILQNEIQ